jgi:hypothetical protein
MWWSACMWLTQTHRSDASTWEKDNSSFTTYWSVEIILVDRPCAMEFLSPLLT